MTTTNPTPDAGGIDVAAVRIIARGIEDWVENSVEYELSRAAAENAIHELTKAGYVLHRPAPGGGGVERVMGLAINYAITYHRIWKEIEEQRNHSTLPIDEAGKALRQAVEALDARPGLRLEEGEDFQEPEAQKP